MNHHHHPTTLDMYRFAAKSSNSWTVFFVEVLLVYLLNCLGQETAKVI